MGKAGEVAVLKTENNKTYKKIIWIIFNVFCNLFILLIAFSIDHFSFDQWLLPFSVLSLIQLFINLITVAKIDKSYFSLITLFLLFSFITHLSILFIFGFEIEVDLPWNPLITISSETFKESCYFVVICHALLTFGICIALKYNKYEVKVENNLNKIDTKLRMTKNIGFILILIGILPMLYIDINRVLLYINGNYLDTYNTGVPGFLVIISRFTEIGIIMLLVGIHKNKKQFYILLIITILYESIIIFTGNRGRPIMFLLTIFYIYINFIKKIGIVQTIKFIISIYFIGFILTFIGEIRMLDKSNFESLNHILINSLKNFTFFEIFAEFGVTVISLGLSLEYFTDSYTYGINYFLSLLTVFPNISGILDTIVTKSIFVYNLPSYTFLGGSYLGELYYNFGSLSYFVIVFIGVFLSFISNQINRSIRQNEFVTLSIYLILFPNILWWTRSYFVDMVREFIWITVLIIFIYIYLKDKRTKQTKSKDSSTA